MKPITHWFKFASVAVALSGSISAYSQAPAAAHNRLLPSNPRKCRRTGV